jgi:hypothetical protein
VTRFYLRVFSPNPASVALAVFRFLSSHIRTGIIMTKTQSIITVLLACVLTMLGIEGDGYLNHAMLILAGVNLCAAFTL